tara:strand:+ start:55 stop:216 length:162 start_codon:yes stop_codon:yes gene_type:complete
MLSKAIDRYMAKKVAKHGMKGAIIWFIGKLVELTPSKKDDQMFDAVKKILDKY